jgi:hypothetical protein
MSTWMKATRQKLCLQVSERTRSYLLVVRQTLLNTVPKAIVFHQVKQAEDNLLSSMQASIAGFEEEQLSTLLGEDPRVAETRKNIKVRPCPALYRATCKSSQHFVVSA